MLPICKLVPDNLFIFQEGHAKLQRGEFDKIFSNVVKEVENDGREILYFISFFFPLSELSEIRLFTTLLETTLLVGG